MSRVLVVAGNLNYSVCKGIAALMSRLLDSEFMVVVHRATKSVPKESAW